MGRVIPAMPRNLLRDWWSFLAMVFVGQCEALVCLGFVEIISFLYFSFGHEAHRSENGASIL